MATRRELSAARRRARYLHEIGEATTAAGRLWKACSWLVVEARRENRLDEVVELVLGVVERVREHLPLPDASHDLRAASNPAPRVDWHARGTHPEHHDRKERRAA